MLIKKIFLKLINNRFLFYRKAYIFESGKDPQSLESILDPSFKLIFPASLNDIDNLNEIHAISPLWKKQFIERLRSDNYKLLLIKSNDQIGYFAWVAFVNEFDKDIGFNSRAYSDKPYLFHCYTFSAFRGRKLHTIGTSYLINYYKNKKESIWGVIDSDNYPALSAWKNAGMERVANITSIGFLNWYKTTTKSNKSSQN